MHQCERDGALFWERKLNKKPISNITNLQTEWNTNLAAAISPQPLHSDCEYKSEAVLCLFYYQIDRGVDSRKKSRTI